MIEEEVYIKHPQGFEVEDIVTLVCKLKKALYGLKQAPRAWYGKIDSFLTSMGFTKSKVDPKMKIMDDLFLIGNEKQIMDCKKKLAEEFEMKDNGLMHHFLGLEVW